MIHHDKLKNLYIINHPLVQHKLSLMRDKNCAVGDFRRLLKEISLLMGYEVTRTLKLKTQKITTPMQDMEAPVLDGPLPVVVPILRAGLGMAEGLVELIPDCSIGHIGLYRDHDTHRPVEYLLRLPDVKDGLYILTDPMLATGHSAEYALDLLARHGVAKGNMSLMCLVAAPEGVRVLAERYPDVPVFTASLDDRLNENAYILPGLGDAGDRIFGTF
jgi:uracil phosphoribosyltransferase